MERGKGTSTRGKGKAQHFPSDLYVLGSKTSSSDSSKRPVPSGSGERKREAPSIPVSGAKKTKTLVGTTTALGKSGTSSPTTSSVEPWEIQAVDIEPSELVDAVLESHYAGQSEKAIKKKNMRAFSEEEVERLLKCIEKEKIFIEDRKSDSDSWRKKEASWLRVCLDFNSSGTLQRSVSNVQNKYKSLKKQLKAKKIVGVNVFTPAEELLANILAQAANGIKSEIDSDIITEDSLGHQTTGSVTSPVPSLSSEPEDTDERHDTGNWNYPSMPSEACKTPVVCNNMEMTPQSSNNSGQPSAKKFKMDEVSTKIAKYTEERERLLLLQRKFTEDEHKLKIENLQLQTKNLRMQNQLLRFKLGEKRRPPEQSNET